jgi:hypothetical protein
MIVSPRAFGARDLTNITYDDNYDLFYQTAFHALSPIVRDAVPRAYERIVRKWGLEDIGGLRHPLTVKIEKIKSPTLQRWQAAYVESRGSGSELRQKMVIDIGVYMEHPDEDVRSVITHEMAHVLLADVTTGSKRGPIPPWFNEGLAQSMTREGKDRVQGDKDRLQERGEHLLLCELDGPLDEFAHGPFNGNCYPEFYLALRRLQQLGGPSAVPKCIQGLHDGAAMPDLVRTVTGMSWTDFKQDVNRYAAAVFADQHPVP